MKLNLKHYKFEKTKKVLRSKGFLIVSVGCFKTLQDRTRKYNLKRFLVKNNICQLIFKSSIFYTFKFLLGSSVVFVDLNSYNYLNKLKNLSIIGIKLYDKIYSLRQFIIVNSIDYRTSIKTFCIVLKKSILSTYLKLIKI